MAYTPVNKSVIQLQADIDAQIIANGVKSITGPIMGQLLSDIVASTFNRISNLNLVGLSEYSTTRAYVGGATGDCCVLSGSILQCVTNTQGTFDASKWKVISGIETTTRAALIAKRDGGTLNTSVVYYATDIKMYFSAKSLTLLSEEVIHFKRTPRFGDTFAGFPLVSWSVIDAVNAPYGVNTFIERSGIVYERTGNTPANNAVAPNINADYTAKTTTDNSYYKDHKISGKYNIDDDQLTEATDQYGTYARTSKAYRDSLGVSDAYMNLIKWGDPRNYGNVFTSMDIDMTNCAATICNVVGEPGSTLKFTDPNSASAVVSLLKLDAGGQFFDVELRENCAVYGMHLSTYGAFSGKIIDTGIVISNWYIGISWNQAETISVNENDVTILPGFSNHQIRMDVDTTLVEYPTVGSGTYALIPTTGQGAGKVELYSGTSTNPPGPIIAIGGGFFGYWPIDFFNDASVHTIFVGHNVNAQSELYFDAGDNQDPFASSKKNGFIRFENRKGTTKWICTASKSIA